MSSAAANADTPARDADVPRHYVVVARRYRPQTFVELIGQEHVAQALSNAIATHRVGHAYLFTGARGVGKTSAARIFAKALNCVQGPTSTPCNQCDICQSISIGEDVDVLEIDGASNRGIDEIRQLRQNAGVRPSRARFKIYIIDEVHMLTREAFNALLKTLEEPPEHVKFIFCTTEPTKIPITILSRCQRFDFAGILTQSIQQRLQQIVAAEGVEAEPEALEVLARRAAGSMRDSQSLLEQLLAFAPGKITVADVHGMLGTAGDERLASLLEHIVSRDSAGALADLDAAMIAGVDASQLIEQLFGCLRDCLVASVGCGSDAFLYTSPSRSEQVETASKQIGLNALLAMMQILDQTLARMRLSTQGRILAELALVRISQLEELEDLSNLIAQLQTGDRVTLLDAPAASASPPDSTAATAAARLKKKFETTVAATGPAVGSENPEDAVSSSRPPSNDEPAINLSPSNVTDVWNRALKRLTGMVVDQARQFESVALAGANRLVVRFKPAHSIFKATCERPEQVTRFEKALREVAGRPIRVEFALSEDGPPVPEPTARAVSPHQRLAEVTKHPLIRQAAELFGAQPVRVDEPTEKR